MRSNISASEHYFELFRKEAESMHTKLASKKIKRRDLGPYVPGTALQDEINELKNEQGTLQSKIKNLSDSKWGLLGTVMDLEEANSKLKGNYGDLYSQHDLLQSEHGKLKSDLDKQIEYAAKAKAQNDAYNTEMRSQLGQANSKLTKATEDVAKLTASQPTGLLGKAYTSLSGIGNTLSSPKVLGVAALAAGLGGGYYLHHLMKKEQKKEEARDTRMRDLGLVGASLAAGLVLPEVGRAIADSTPFTDSSFSEEDIRRMRGR